MSEEAREVALARVARSPKAQAFTGADLQAIVDTAQLAAIHSYLEVKRSGRDICGLSCVRCADVCRFGGGGTCAWCPLRPVAHCCQ